MGQATPKPPFDWWGVLERGVWTGIQAPAGLAVADAVVTNAELPAASYFVAAGVAVAVSVVKTLAQHRLRWLDTRPKR